MIGSRSQIGDQNERTKTVVQTDEGQDADSSMAAGCSGIFYAVVGALRASVEGFLLGFLLVCGARHVGIAVHSI